MTLASTTLVMVVHTISIHHLLKKGNTDLGTGFNDDPNLGNY